MIIYAIIFSTWKVFQVENLFKWNLLYDYYARENKYEIYTDRYYNKA